LKSAAVEVVKSTPVLSDYLDDDADTKAKMNAKYGFPTVKSSAPNGSLMLASSVMLLITDVVCKGLWLQCLLHASGLG
jgi:hypothetical protein